MKNLLIGIMAVIILATGGWLLYNNLVAPSSPNATANVSGQPQQSAGTQPAIAKTLDLSNQGLTEVGPAIYDKTDTVQLILSHNNLKSLKSEMGRMTSLQILKLDHNRLEGSLIGEIRKMPLKTLDASYNNMTGIPAEIGQLNQLETLDYSYNHINTYPNELAKLTQLKTLNLTGNPFTAAQIAEIKAKLPNTNVIF